MEAQLALGLVMLIFNVNTENLIFKELCSI